MLTSTINPLSQQVTHHPSPRSIVLVSRLNHSSTYFKYLCYTNVIESDLVKKTEPWQLNLYLKLQ